MVGFAAPSEISPPYRRTITLTGDRVLVDVESIRTTAFAAAGVPKDRQWHEPKRESLRPRKGYIGCKTTIRGMWRFSRK